MKRLEGEAAPSLRRPASPSSSPVRRSPARRAVRLDLLAGAVALALVGAGIALRFAATSALWLDEALSVNIARLPLHEIPQALRHDGAPPLYYLLLHAWMSVFGTTDAAVRSLSGVLSVATLPLMWRAGRRMAGRAGAWGALVLLASSPFAIRYATEARMYALLTFLVVVGYLVLSASLENPSPGRLVAVAVVGGLIALTHYWALYLLGVAAVFLAVTARVRRSAAAWRTLGALAAGGLLFAPWAGVFLFQARHTGTPWHAGDSAQLLLTFLQDWSGTNPFKARLVGFVLAGLFVLGVFGRPVDGRRMELDLRGRPASRGTALVAAAALVAAVGLAHLTRTVVALRYTAVVFPLFLLVAGAGLAAFGNRTVRYLVLGAAAVAGLLGARGVGDSRTGAEWVAGAIGQAGAAGDVVGYCPDQLGPPVSRLLGSRFRQFTFPRLSGPERIDWVDYERRNQAGDPAAFATGLLRRAGANANVWLVSSSEYKGAESLCERVRRELLQRRPGGLTALEANEGSKRETVDLFPTGGGYWVATADGQVRTFGDAAFFGSAEGIGPERPVVGIEPTPGGRGYWLVASDGTVLSFGDARGLSPARAAGPGRTVVGMASTPTGRGYWLAMADGGVLAYGDAPALGTSGPMRMNGPVIAIGATPTGAGYWLFGGDGGVFSFGDAPYLGSATSLDKPFVSADSGKGEAGYWLVSSDGTVFTSDPEGFHGGPDTFPLGSAPVALSGVPSDRGYWVASADGTILPFGATPARAQLPPKVPGAVGVEGWIGRAEQRTRLGRFFTAQASPAGRKL